MPKIISRAQARAEGLTYYWTGVPCKSGHSCERRVDNCACMECSRIKSRDLYRRNPEPARARRKRNYYEDVEKSRSQSREHYQNNPEYYQRWRDDNKEHIKEISKYHYEKNKEAISERQTKHREIHKDRINAYIKQWKKLNAAKVKAYGSKRKTLMRHSRPLWLDIESLILIYTDVPPEENVDHEIPLVHPLVCGLHVPWNLKRIPSLLNKRKSNYFNPDEWHFDPVSSSFIRTISPEAPDYEKPLDMAA